MHSTSTSGTTRPADSTTTMDHDAIRVLVARLSRPHRSGGDVIERATILAEGADSAAVFAWIAAHDGRPETQSSPVARGLHGAGLTGGSAVSATPRRYVLPAGALS